MKLSEINIEKIKELANGMSIEEINVFIAEVDRHVLEKELSRRADENEKALEDIKKRLVLNV